MKSPYISADEDVTLSGFQEKFKTFVIVDSSGVNKWMSPATFKSSCDMLVTFYPFDKQRCEMTFGSWTFDNRLLKMVSKSKKHTHAGLCDLHLMYFPLKISICYDQTAGESKDIDQQRDAVLMYNEILGTYAERKVWQSFKRIYRSIFGIKCWSLYLFNQKLVKRLIFGRCVIVIWTKST